MEFGLVLFRSLTRLGLHDDEPAPRPRIARRGPESLLVLGTKRLEANDAPVESRCRPRLHPRDSKLGPRRSQSTRAWSESRTSTTSDDRNSGATGTRV